MMKLPLDAEAPPLREDGHGGYRVGKTRVLFDLVVSAFKDGATAEAIVLSHDTLELADAYSTLAYYLRHRDEVDRYLAERDHAADELKKELAWMQPDLAGIRERMLRARRGA